MTAAPGTIAGLHVGSTDPLFLAVLRLPPALAALITGALAARADNTGPGTSGTAAPTSSAWRPCAQREPKPGYIEQAEPRQGR
jgi:hypothetical protein